MGGHDTFTVEASQGEEIKQFQQIIFFSFNSLDRRLCKIVGGYEFSRNFTNTTRTQTSIVLVERGLTKEAR